MPVRIDDRWSYAGLPVVRNVVSVMRVEGEQP